MTRLLLLLLVSIPVVAAADPSADAVNADAAKWIDTLVHNKKPAATGPVAIVFDSGSLFKSDTACGKLRVATKASAADLTTLASCMQAATKQLGLDGAALPDAKGVSSVGTKYLRSWFRTSLGSSIVIPAGSHAIGASISRPVPGAEGAGVGIMVYVVYDATGRATAIFAYAGRWAYPV